MKQFPARLHILLARTSTKAVILRRGPAKQVCTIGWDRSNDTFSIGQWLKGRIYERRSDLSPNGDYLIYFAMNGKWDSELQGSWTAISRSPFLKGISLFAKGDCWCGGGLFTGDKTYWLNSTYEKQTLNSHEVCHDINHVLEGHYGGECEGVYFPRLIRDGWNLVTYRKNGTNGNVSIFEKMLSSCWILRKIAHASSRPPVGKGCYYDTHQLVERATGAIHDYADWEWADVDNNRIIWTEKGKLWAAQVGDEGLRGIMFLNDFNDMKFENLCAPY